MLPSYPATGARGFGASVISRATDVGHALVYSVTAVPMIAMGLAMVTEVRLRLPMPSGEVRVGGDRGGVAEECRRDEQGMARTRSGTSTDGQGCAVAGAMSLPHRPPPVTRSNR